MRTRFILMPSGHLEMGSDCAGEEACKWVVITDTDCELMVIPRYMLLKYGKNMVWDRLKDQLNHTYPSIDQIVRSLTKEKRWSRYKHRLAKNLR